METKKIKASLVDINAGQIEGVPSNPRNWTVRELEKLQKSLQETPELLNMRPPIVVRQEGRYVAIGGNMRVCAQKESGAKEIECIVLPDGLPASKLKEIIIKDNASIGAWDVESLLRDWISYDLVGFGIPEAVIPEGTFSGVEGGGASSGGSGGGSGSVGPGVDNRTVIEIEFPAKEFSFVNVKLREYGESAEEAVLNLLGL